MNNKKENYTTDKSNENKKYSDEQIQDLTLEDALDMLRNTIETHSNCIAKLDDALHTVLIPEESEVSFLQNDELIDEYNTPSVKNILQLRYTVLYLNRHVDRILNRLRLQ